MARVRAPKSRHNFDVATDCIGDVEGDFSIVGYLSPFDPGRTYGPPEKCYPPEGGDVEEHEVWEVTDTAIVRREDLDDDVDLSWLAEAASDQMDALADDGPDEDDYRDREEMRAENREYNRERYHGED